MNSLEQRGKPSGFGDCCEMLGSGFFQRAAKVAARIGQQQGLGDGEPADVGAMLKRSVSGLERALQFDATAHLQQMRRWDGCDGPKADEREDVVSSRRMTFEAYDYIHFLLRLAYQRRATSSNDPITGSPASMRRSAST